MKRALVIVVDDDTTGSAEWRALKALCAEAPQGIKAFAFEACAAGEIEQEAIDRTEPAEDEFECEKCGDDTAAPCDKHTAPEVDP